MRMHHSINAALLAAGFVFTSNGCDSDESTSLRDDKDPAIIVFGEPSRPDDAYSERKLEEFALLPAIARSCRDSTDTEGNDYEECCGDESYTPETEIEARALSTCCANWPGLNAYVCWDADLAAHDPYGHPLPPLVDPLGFDLVDEAEPSAACVFREHKNGCNLICDSITASCKNNGEGTVDCTWCTAAGCTTKKTDGCDPETWPPKAPLMVDDLDLDATP